MFVTLLVVTFIIALGTSLVVVRLFSAPIDVILDRVVSPELSGAWHRYLNFADVVVGVSGGVRVWELEKYYVPHAGHGTRLAQRRPMGLGSLSNPDRVSTERCLAPSRLLRLRSHRTRDRAWIRVAPRGQSAQCLTRPRKEHA